MKQIPMLFSPAMIEALLAGRKTETRRTRFAINGYPNFFQFGRSDTRGYDWTFRRKDHVWEDFRHDELMQRMQTQVGDLIWVKENYRGSVRNDCDKPSEMPDRPIWYEADRGGAEYQSRTDFGKLRPSIHMPKAFSRLTLRVTSFGIERLHDIDEAGAIAEGIEETKYPNMRGVRTWRDYTTGRGVFTNPRDSYRTLWNSINGPDAWDANPWVSVTKFEVIRQNVEAVA